MNLFHLRSSRVFANSTQLPSFHKFATRTVLLSFAIAVAPWPSAQAAENISLEYGPIQRSLPVKELKSFAETKKPSGLLADLITLAQQTPETVHGLLTATVPIKVTTMDRMVNSYIGSVILGQVGKVILPTGRTSDPVTPLKAAFVGGIKNDQFSILNFIESYPVDMRINGEEFFAIRKQLEEDGKHLPEILSGLQGILSKVIPGFSLNPAAPETSPATSPTPSSTVSPSATPSPTITPTPSPSITPTPSSRSSLTPSPKARVNSEVVPQRTYPLQF